jgi:hypothetical protein
MKRDPLPDRLEQDASWLAQAIDPKGRLVRFVRMDAAGYRAASFLDDRLLQGPHESRLCELDPALLVAERARDDARWIFHIGHVGSTLVSRLLGELEGVLALREPRSLRDLSFADAADAAALAAALRRLMARTFAPDEAALVKATSVVSELAPLLIAPGASALFLFATPANYVASILAGENSVQEVRTLHEFRHARLARRGIAPAGFDRSDAHRAAAAWACEMTSLMAAETPDRRVLWADFDRMLGDMTGALEACARHFGFAAPAPRIDAIARGPLMGRYSKALEYDYSPALRAELLAEAKRDHAADIDQALAALRDAASGSPVLARAIERAERES